MDDEKLDIEDLEIEDTLDCFGYYCPQPLFQTRESLENMEAGQILEVLADDPAAEEDLKRFCNRVGYKLLLFEKKGVELRFLIQKT